MNYASWYVVVVVVVWFGDPCESPGALLLKAAPGASWYPNALELYSVHIAHAQY